MGSVRAMDAEKDAREHELRAKFAHYLAKKDEFSKSGNFHEYSELFVSVSPFVDHHGFGRFEGRDRIREYIVKSIAPFGTMHFFIDWVAVDVASNAVVFQVQNAFPGPPFRKDGGHFQFPNWTRLVFCESSGLIKSEETVYNPLRDAGKTVKDWIQAGGTFVSKEQLKYQYSKYPASSKDISKL